MRPSAIRKRMRRLARSLPDPAVEELPADVAAYVLQHAMAVALRTGERGTSGSRPGTPLSVVDHAMALMIRERLEAIERGDTGPWIDLMDGEYQDERLSTDPTAVAELERILSTVGWDINRPAAAPAPERVFREPQDY